MLLSDRAMLAVSLCFLSYANRLLPKASYLLFEHESGINQRVFPKMSSFSFHDAATGQIGYSSFQLLKVNKELD